jgi:SAM-dependent methyltransferase
MTGLVHSPVGTELLDDPRADAAAVAESLRHIARANRWFGGTTAVLRGVQLALAGVPRGAELSLLDLGTGIGDLPLAVVRYAARRGVTVVPLGLEVSPVAATLARESGVPVARADIGALPFGPRSVDLVLLSQVAHHFAPDSIVEILRTADRLARRAVIVADLRRSRVALAGFSVGARVMRFDRLTRADGRTSIRRGFSAAALQSLLERAGIHAPVRRSLGWRLFAVWRPT